VLVGAGELLGWSVGSVGLEKGWFVDLSEEGWFVGWFVGWLVAC